MLDNLLKEYKPILRALIFISVLFLSAYIAFIAPQSFLKQYQLEEKIKSTQIKIELLQQDSVLLQDTIQRLNNDTAFIEYIARTQLGMAKKGEVVYYLPPQKKKND